MSERFESTDIDAGSILRAARWLVGILLIVFIAMFLFSHFFKGNARSITNPRFEPPSPRLQNNPARDLADLRAREDASLTSYRWVNRHDPIVSIPIERAIDLTIERGLPTRPSP